MRFWRVAALVVVAALPLFFASKKKEDVRPVAGDVDNIFDQELTVD